MRFCFAFALFLQARNRSDGISGENDLELANQRAGFIGFKYKSYSISY